MEGGKPPLRPNDEQRASFLSRAFFAYLWPLLWKGFRKELGDEDICAPIEGLSSEAATARLTREWEKEKRDAKRGRRAPSLNSVVWRVTRMSFLKVAILVLIEEFGLMAQPIAIGRLIRYFRFDSPMTFEEGLMAAAAIALSGIIIVFVHHPYFFSLQKVGMLIKVGTSGMVLQKGVRLSSGALHRTTVGHMINLLSSDVAKFDTCFLYINYLWLAPLMFVCYSYLLWKEIGVSCLPGLGGVILLGFVQTFFSRKIAKCREEIAKRTDKRVSVMSEILNGIRAIKMYAWEDAFANVIGQLRRKELGAIRVTYLLQSIQFGLLGAAVRVILLMSLLLYILIETDLSAEHIFVAASFFSAIRWPVSFGGPWAVKTLLEARVSISRIQAFLELEEFQSLKESPQDIDDSQQNGYLEKYSNSAIETMPLMMNGVQKSEVKQRADSDAECTVELQDFSCTWDSVEGEESVLAIREVTLKARPNQLIAIVGPVGCGKSALLSSILRETHRVSGSLKVRGRVAYVCQDSWIFSGTLRENILFGEPYDEARFMETVHVCALHKDIARMRKGDLTMVGDRGQSLSGGQKARVSLARAVYRNADIYLLDDPLSAVDAAVGHTLFKRCISGFLKSKVTILVTHQVQLLKDVDQILLMREGKVVASGTMSEVAQLSTFTEILQETEKSYSRQTSKCEAHLEVSNGSDQSSSNNESSGEDESFVRNSDAKETSSLQSKRQALKLRKQRKTSEDQTIFAAQKKDEKSEEPEDGDERRIGTVSWKIYGEYMRCLGWGRSVVPGCIVLALLVQIFHNFIDWWFSQWAHAMDSATKFANFSQVNETLSDEEMAQRSKALFAYEDHISVGPFAFILDLADYRNTYTAMVAIFLVVCVTRAIWFRLSQLKASRGLHDRMLNAVVNTRVLFFDKNPVGRILNRFSKDVDTMDDSLSFAFFDFVLGIMDLVGLVSVIVALNPVMFGPTAVIFIIFAILRHFYLHTSRALKRLESTTRSPLYSHISAVMEGLITVRAYSNEQRALNIYHEYQDRNSSSFYMSIATSRVFASTIDWLSCVFITCVSFIMLFSPVMGSGEAGLSLMYVVQLTGWFSWLMRQSALLQNQMVSVERIVNYSELPVESKDGTTPPPGWPTAGHLYFNCVSLRYDETSESEWALTNIEADVHPNEKIGIVGRTGAGKSSLLRALFRLTEPVGRIFIDGIDTRAVALKELRKRISVIPQDPVLFIGTLRQNLDPFGEFSDEKLWAALEQVQLKGTVGDQGLALDMHMQEGGANFSVGQRQLICLARALLRHARVLVLDEATANVDSETDALIQRTIREHFACSTILTVAHRLHTIIDSDRVMVLQDGRLIEFDHPYTLLANEESLFSGLVNETGEENANLLRRLAAVNFGDRRAAKKAN